MPRARGRRPNPAHSSVNAGRNQRPRGATPDLTEIAERDETSGVSGPLRTARASGGGAVRRLAKPEFALFWGVFVLLCLPASVAQAAAPWRIAPTPTWPVTNQPLRTVLAPLGAEADASGQRVWLLSHEVRLTTSVESFWHVTRRITGQAGLQTNSQLNVEFDPSYQTLVFHYVDLHRGATRINELDRRAVKLVQREADLENQIFDSRESAVIFLEDLRVGDVVDYAYTVEGSDPTLAGTVDEAFLLGLPVPVDHLFARLATNEDRSLSVSRSGPSSVDDGALAPRINHDSTEFRWDLFATKAYPVEADAPTYFDQLPLARLSGFKSWHDVAVWAGIFFHPRPRSAVQHAHGQRSKSGRARSRSS